MFHGISTWLLVWFFPTSVFGVGIFFLIAPFPDLCLLVPFYYPSGETKGADQLRSYCESDLRLCFRICKIPVFSRCGSYYNVRMVRLGTSFPGQAQTRAVNQ